MNNDFDPDMIYKALEELHQNIGYLASTRYLNTDYATDPLERSLIVMINESANRVSAFYERSEERRRAA